MYNIAICDDQIICGETLELSLNQIMSDYNTAYKVDIYTSGLELLRNLESKEKEYDILFLDILMGEDEINGMELAKKIRCFDDNISIVFVTSSTDYVLDGYSVRALQYLIKPVDNKILREVLDYELKNKNNVSVVFKEKDSTRKVPASDIVHIETSGRNVKVFLKDEEFNAYNKISDVEKMLPSKDFIRCHQSFIININNIKEIRHGEAVSIIETVVPVSRTQWSKVKKLFVDRH